MHLFLLELQIFYGKKKFCVSCNVDLLPALWLSWKCLHSLHLVACIFLSETEGVLATVPRTCTTFLRKIILPREIMTRSAFENATVHLPEPLICDEFAR